MFFGCSLRPAGRLIRTKMNYHEDTVRRRIIEALKGGLLSAKDISKAVGIREKEVAEHLEHVSKTISHAGMRGERLKFVVEHSVCISCGFVFRKRDRLKTPGRCPVCRSEEITETRFGIIEE